MSEPKRSAGAVALVHWRAEKGFERSQVAAMLGCSYETVRFLERGERRPSEILQKLIAAVTGIDARLWSDDADEAA